MKTLLYGSAVRLVACAALGLGAAGLGGCIAYNTVEPIEGATGFDNPNSPPVPEAMATALQWVALRYPPHVDRLDLPTERERPDVAVNFPIGVRRTVAEYVCRHVGPWAWPLKPENDTLPIYHIGRVWTRGPYATVDIFRPSTQLGEPPRGQTLWQCITVNLRSGIGSYSVASHKVWPVGAFEEPALHYLSPGHEGRTQPAPGERPGTIPPLPGEKRTPATGAPHPTPEPDFEETPVIKPGDRVEGLPEEPE